MSKWEIDLGRITLREYRRLFDKEQAREEEDVTIAKAAGITVEELNDLPLEEYKRLLADLFRKAKEPVDAKN